MIFTGTLLPQDESPLENQKSTLDLLKKINTVSELIPVQTESLAIITSDTLLGSNIRNVIVNTALAVSITIPDGLPMGTEIQITQVYASTSRITLKRKGNDTIEGAASVSYGINISSLSIMKISKTNWSRVKGAGIIESYTDANGNFIEKSGAGRMRITGVLGALITTTSANGSIYYATRAITFPVSFKTGTTPSVIPLIHGGNEISWMGKAVSITETGCTLVICGANNAVTAYPYYIAEGFY